jgi:hypothetical protein
VCEYKVVEPDLSTQQLVHVDFVGVERAEQNLSKYYAERNSNYYYLRKKRNITRAPTGILSRESTRDSFCIIITCYKIQ